MRSTCLTRCVSVVSSDYPTCTDPLRYPQECLQETPHVLDLMTPSNTVMDQVRTRRRRTHGIPKTDTVLQSLALALYFASRGKGALRQDSQLELYSSTAKVLLSGLGADECVSFFRSTISDIAQVRLTHSFGLSQAAWWVRSTSTCF